MQETYAAYLKEVGIGVAAIEWVEDTAGQRYVYDINTNTNYNSRAERLAGLSAPRELAQYLTAVLQQETIQN